MADISLLVDIFTDFREFILLRYCYIYAGLKVPYIREIGRYNWR